MLFSLFNVDFRPTSHTGRRRCVGTQPLFFHCWSQPHAVKSSLHVDLIFPSDELTLMFHGLEYFDTIYQGFAKAVSKIWIVSMM